MSYTEDEAERLKGIIKEIVNERNLSLLHEMKKKLALSESKQQSLKDRLARVEKDIKKMEECHICKKHMGEFRNATTQCDQVIASKLEHQEGQEIDDDVQIIS